MPPAMTADDLAGWLSLLFKQVIAGDAEPRVAQAAATIARVLLEARAAGELEHRLADLEARASMSDQRWSA
jgi:hypothetical protein